MITKEEFIKSVPIDSETAGKSYDELIEQFSSNLEQVEYHLNNIIIGFKSLGVNGEQQ
jgi:hypothetical protein